MRCSCRVCGTYMVQMEHGLESGCKCPACGDVCRDCMGSAQQPLSVEELRFHMVERLRMPPGEDGEEGLDPLEAMRPDPDTD